MVYYHTCSCALDPSHSTGGCLRSTLRGLGSGSSVQTQTHTSLPSLSTSRHVIAPRPFATLATPQVSSEFASHRPIPMDRSQLPAQKASSASSMAAAALARVTASSFLSKLPLTASSWRATCQSDHGTSTIATTLLSDSKCMTLVSGVPTRLLAAAATSLSAAPMTCDYERQRQVLESEVSFRQQGMMDKRNTEDRALSRCYSHCARSRMA